MLKKLLKISGSFFLGLLIFLIAWWLFSRINSSFADKIFNFSSPISWFIFAIATGILILVHIQKAGWTNRALRTLGIAFLSLLFIVCASVLFVNSDAGQNILTKAVTNHFSKELKTKISLRHISLSLLNKMNLEGFYVEDQQKDTLLYAGKLSVRITDWFVF
ncbi:MAG: hypothetical protein JST09_18605, partial [Bacteroidetes bacterium]|nr:hypothetical protein [Bacteroidota bacterium]